jgi:xanthine dehydrogenase iron-sulfur cluster and FAD-binding subunit A
MSPNALFARKRPRPGRDSLDKATLARAAAAAEAIAAPAADGRGSAEYRTKMAGVMTARALKPRLRSRSILKGPDMSKSNRQHDRQRQDGFEAAVEPRTLLIHYLRENLGLTGRISAATPAIAAPARSTSTASR